MSENSDDKELQAISVTLASLKDLDEAARNRVISYVLTRLGMKAEPEPRRTPPSIPHQQSLEPQDAPENLNTSRRMKDVRSFKEEKNPKSANEMAALVAYYLQYEAGDKERQETITKADIEKYFHLAKFTKPKDAKSTLQNSKNAGYLEARDRGAFALSPVGYNLVAHSLPRKTT